MSINIADNMAYNGKKPLDARISYATLALMKAVTDANIYEGCLAYCAETDKYYKFLSTNTVDADTGKWREFSSGSAGTTDYTDLENKPSINEVEVSGDLSASDLGLATPTDLQGKQDKIQQTSMPTASEDLEGAVYQYLGSTTSTYTHGHWYECVSDGEDPATYSWEEVDVQSLTAGDGISISGNEISTDNMPSADMDEIITPLPSYSGGSSNPTGTIISFMGIYAPDGYLACDGSTYNIADYPRLANFFLVQFGSVNNFGGDGTTTFAVPNLQGEFLRGTGTNSHTNQGNGSAVGSHQDATAIPVFAGASNGQLFVRSNLDVTNLGMSNGDATYKRSSSGTIKNNVVTGTQNASSETYDSVGVRPTNTSVLFCIKD